MSRTRIFNEFYQHLEIISINFEQSVNLLHEKKKKSQDEKWATWA